MKFKDLFSTPKKIATTLGISVISIGVLSSVSLFTVYAIAETNSVGKEEAVKNAYAAAGITESEVDAVDVDFKFRDGKFVYDVEFYSKGKEYEYVVWNAPIRDPFLENLREVYPEFRVGE